MGEAIRVLKFAEAVEHLQSLQYESRQNYYAMYSSWMNGIITDPALMMVPIDDHLVHRGDGIFEAIKFIGGRIYALDRHLERLERSAELVHMSMPMSRPEMVSAIRQTIRVAGVQDGLIRLFVSRGPGGFTTNPYECIASQLYVVITKLAPPSAEKYENGVTLKTSAIPVKEGFFANVKSCNYLSNVLMKKEAVDAGVDFTVSLDERGCLGEGSTENMAIITKKREFLVPGFQRTLRGVTVLRMMELAKSLLESGDLTRIGEADLRNEQVYGASEVLLLGTTMDVLPVVKYDGHAIGDGVPGPVFGMFLKLLRKDLQSGSGMLTAVEG